MNILATTFTLLLFPSGVFVIVAGLMYEWAARKTLARLQNRIGPRWMQPFADVLKLLSKEEIIPAGVNRFLFLALPVGGMSGALTAALYVPSLLTLCIGLAGSNTHDLFSLLGATRTLTQVFSYEAPFLLALLGPAMVAGSWQIDHINAYASTHWMLLSQPIGFVIAIIGLMGKLEMPPFDAPEAETEIVAGAFTEYSGRGLALFRLGKAVELMVGLTLVAAFFLGGLHNPLDFLVKTLILLAIMAVLQVLLTRFRIDQVVRWWRYGALLALVQMLAMIGWVMWNGGVL